MANYTYNQLQKTDNHTFIVHKIRLYKHRLFCGTVAYVRIGNSSQDELDQIIIDAFKSDYPGLKHSAYTCSTKSHTIQNITKQCNIPLSQSIIAMDVEIKMHADTSINGWNTPIESITSIPLKIYAPTPHFISEHIEGAFQRRTQQTVEIMMDIDQTLCQYDDFLK